MTYPSKILRIPLVAVAIALLSHPGLAGSLPCALPSVGVVTQAGRLRLGDVPLTVAAVTLPDINTDTSRLLVLDRHCRRLWSATVDGAETRFDVRMLANTPLLQFVTLQVYGDGTGFVHRLLVLNGGRLTLVLPPVIHTGKDGFYLGRLHGDGDGMVTWSADPGGESEASAHPYVVTVWQFAHGRFGQPVSRETATRYLPSDTIVPRADSVAKAMRLPYRDQTAQSAFMDFGHLESLLQKAEETQAH